MGADGVQQHGNAIQAAKSAGAKRILYTGHQGKGPASIFIPTKENHVPTDALLAECGVPYVSLQNEFLCGVGSVPAARDARDRQDCAARRWASLLDGAG